MGARVPISFFLNPDVVALARQLLGMELYCQVGGICTGGRIVETEAYKGEGDRGCHAYNGRRTARNEVMYHTGGVAYVYICYGMHTLCNVVSNVAGKADAVLLRGLEPCLGEDDMRQRRQLPTHAPRKWLSAGPGRLSQALGIQKDMSGLSLRGQKLWLAKGNPVSDQNVIQTTRIGLASAGEAAHYPWRFYVKDNPFVSQFASKAPAK